MATYPYYPYQSYYPVYQPMIQQPTQPPVQQPVQQPSYSSGIIWVDDEKEAALYPIAPNNAVALWEKSGKKAYMKKADATGKPSMTTYDLVERKEEAEVQDVSYATKDDYAAVVGVVKEFSEKVSALTAELESMKGDLYGIAGKKKAKKVVEDDDE